MRLATPLIGVWSLLFGAWCSAATTYAYDSLNRLTGVDYGKGTTIAYTYDPAGNRLSMVTTAAVDTSPNAFSFAPLANIPLTAQEVSESITVTGINAAAAISVTGGQYSVNGGAWTSAAGTVTAGQSVQLRTTSSASFSTSVSVVLTIGGVAGTFTVTTQSATQTSTATTLGSSANPSKLGDGVTFTATVSGNAPTGNVNFIDGTNSIVGCSVVPLVSGHATCVTNLLAFGSHSITALYSGGGNNAASASSAVSQIILGYRLALTGSQGGSVNASPNQSGYAPGTVVTLSALPVVDYVFGGWTGDAVGNANPIQLTMNADHSVGAVFNPILVPTDATPAGPSSAPGAAGTVLIIPVVAKTTSFASEIFISNPSAASVNVNLRYYGARGTTGAGLQTCTVQSLPAKSTVALAIANACPNVPSGSQFGMLVIEEALLRTPLTAYSRTQNPGGNGFSIEGYPIGEFSPAPATVTGLKRVAVGPPPFQTNCFVGALGEALNYQILLVDGGTGQSKGSPVTGTLQAWETVRYLDIFGPSGANAPAGDYSNIRADFSVVGATRSALVGFCTVQDNVSFGADFRLAKSIDAQDSSQLRLVHLGHNGTGTLTQPEVIYDLTRKHVFVTSVRHPDALACSVVGPRSADLEIRLREPGVIGNTAIVAGGNNQNSFSINLGGRASINAGIAGYWVIETSFREGGDPTLPIAYGLTCTAGNGMSVPLLLNPVGFSDDF